MDAALTKADTNADGKLSLEEIKKFLVPENPPVDPVVPSTNDTTSSNTTENATNPEVEPVKNET